MLRFLPTEQTLALLIAERDKLNCAIEGLQGRQGASASIRRGCRGVLLTLNFLAVQWRSVEARNDAMFRRVSSLQASVAGRPERTD